MSLLNRGGNTPGTIIIKEITRSRNESFGDSFMKDAALAAGPAAKFTNNVYRNKALKAVEKRNSILGTESEYLKKLCNMNVGDNVSVSGNYEEANFFNYISNYCEMEILVQKRNMECGNTSPVIEEMLKNPPAPNASHMTKVSYIKKVEAECRKDMGPVSGTSGDSLGNKVLDGIKKKSIFGIVDKLL